MIYFRKRERRTLLYHPNNRLDYVKKTAFILLSHNLKNPFQRQPEKARASLLIPLTSQIQTKENPWKIKK